jgi:hypothetical protein
MKTEGDKIGINRTVWINCTVLPASVIYRAPKDTITRVSETLLFFDAIPTGWVSKHYSIGPKL